MVCQCHAVQNADLCNVENNSVHHSIHINFDHLINFFALWCRKLYAFIFYFFVSHKLLLNAILNDDFFLIMLILLCISDNAIAKIVFVFTISLLLYVIYYFQHLKFN